MNFLKYILLIFIILLVTSSYSQTNDTEIQDSIPIHSPKKATLYSTFLPGLGQIYNKKYWKLPIVYAGFGVTGYFAFSNRTEYLKYKEAYLCSEKENNEEGYTCDNPLTDKYNTSDLKSITDYYRRNMELSFILMGAWYILQILDATVDAHLYYWNVDDNPTLKVEPVIQPFNIPNELPAQATSR